MSTHLSEKKKYNPQAPVTFLSYLYQKDSVVSNVNVAAIFTQLFDRNCSQLVIFWQLRTVEWFVNKGICAWYTLIFWTIISCKSNSSVVESLPRKLWIGSSNPSGNYTLFSVSRRMNPFSSENCSLCTLYNKVNISS